MTDATTHQPPQMNTAPTGTVRVWDPLIRIFHWSLVVAFILAWLTADEWQTTHEVAGYTVAGLVAFRLVWGFAGSRYARFAQFLKGPGTTLGYIGDMMRGRERRHLGHNPAGAAMVVALLVTLSGTAVTGWLMEDETRVAMLPEMPAIVAPAWADDDGDAQGQRGGEEGALEEVHETLANLMLLLVALHVGGVVLASFRHHENLARAMVTGDKRARGPDDIA
ncbi:cytochrome b/b6 domain-containing protein [Sedimentitalea sp. JM2-8]|uniref:Cytochrome b/b6 domain-containing protein n=1 Tax=Sedimentitalea xiamensis TaxID=3050037 RepID=A0ABT7FCW8_9RHOB|nr:cytochrome b/b6 domain-containing protein [Sedimentitalea xiamensis]MDK3072958.1 cytochrome b/b6 domain-containing protein [Sedimentitalea xiamensis]